MSKPTLLFLFLSGRSTPWFQQEPPPGFLVWPRPHGAWEPGGCLAGVRLFGAGVALRERPSLAQVLPIGEHIRRHVAAVRAHPDDHEFEEARPRGGE